MTPQDLATALNLHPLVAEILIQRGCDTAEAARAFLDPDHYTPASPFDLPHMDRAVARLRDAIARGERIRVWGDFDVDGQTATSVLLLGLRALGATVDFTIPDRAAHSHGLNTDGIRRAADEGVRVLLTCDCGVTDFAEVAFAQRLGLDVIISDHHDLAHNDDGSSKFPKAVAVINPKRLPDNHPLIHLPGVGVAYKLVEALSSPPRVPMSSLLDLVALGIVADVAWQRGDTRYLLQRGLAQLRRAPRLGIRALMRAANIDPLDLDADDIAYQIGPRLNAAGRLDSAALSVELLTSDDEARANGLASKIEVINTERKAMQRTIELEALAMLERDPGLTRPSVIVLESPRWHVSLLGVVASAVVNRYHKPAILIAAQPGEVSRGSARSIEGVDIHAAIEAQSHLIEGGGGHPMAAGFGIRSENIVPLRDAVSRHVEHQLEANAATSHLQSPISYVVAWRDATLPLAEQLERLAPFGAGNPRPLLRSEHLKLVRADPLGRDGRHQAVYLQDADGMIARAAWFNSTLAPLPGPTDDVALAFSLQRDMFNGKVRAQAVVKAMEFDGQAAAPAEAGGEGVTLTAPFLIRDLRGEADRPAVLRSLLDETGREAVQVCSRAPKPESLATFDGWLNRARVQAGPVPVPMLVLWDAPPGPAELADVLYRASPQTVVLMCSTAGENDDAAAVMARMQHLIALSEQRGDSLDDPAIVTRMAAAINQRDETVRATVAAHRAGAAHSPRLRYLLDETRAYRRYACEAPAADVLRVR